MGFWVQLNRLIGNTTDSSFTLAGADGESRLITTDFNFLSQVTIRCTNRLINEGEYIERINRIKKILKTLLRSNQMYVTFEYEPDGTAAVKHNLAGAYQRAKALRLPVESLLDERCEKLGPLVHTEQVSIGLVTGFAGVGKEDVKRYMAKRQKVLATSPYVSLAQAQQVVPVADLRSRHEAAVDTLLAELRDTGLMAERDNSEKILTKLRHQLYPNNTSRRWRPKLFNPSHLNQIAKGFSMRSDSRALSFKKKSVVKEVTGAVPDRLVNQLLPIRPWDDDDYSVWGNTVYAPLYMSSGPTDPMEFNRLVRLMSEQDVPFRLQFGLKNETLALGVLSDMLGTISWMHSKNSARKQLIDRIKEQQEDLCGLSITGCTWAPVRNVSMSPDGRQCDLSEVQERQQTLMQVLEAWGNCNVSSRVGVAYEAVLATTAAYLRPRAPYMVPPLSDALALMPLNRPGSAWEVGNTLFQSNDGKLLSVQQRSSLQSYESIIVVGPPGYAKSSTLFRLNLDYLLSPDATASMPVLRCLDIGPSQKELVTLVTAASKRAGSYEEGRYLYVQIRPTPEYQMNPFDLPFGFDKPTPYKIGTVQALLQIILADEYKQSPLVKTLIADLITYVYKVKARNGDKNKPYTAGTIPDIHNELLKDPTFLVDQHTMWWEVADYLNDRGKTSLAKWAYLQCMPTLEDFSIACSSPELTQEYTDLSNGTTLLNLVSRKLRAAQDMFPLLKGATRFLIDNTRVLIMDAQYLIVKGENEDTKWRNAVNLAICNDRLCGDLFLDEEDIRYCPKAYLSYHQQRMRELTSVPRRVSSDENHIFNGVPGGQEHGEEIQRTGRKNGVGIVQSSHYLFDFSTVSQSMSTTIVILGVAGNSGKEMISSELGLTTAELDYLDSVRPPTSRGSQGLLLYKTRSQATTWSSVGFYNPEGPRFLWLAATEVEDRKLRELAYLKTDDPMEAIEALAEFAPSGKVKGLIERILMDRGLSQLDATGDSEIDEHSTNLIEDFAKDVFKIMQKNRQHRTQG